MEKMDIIKLLNLSKKISCEIESSVSKEKINNIVNNIVKNTNQEDMDFIFNKVIDYLKNNDISNDNDLNKKSQSLCVVCLTNKSNTSFIHEDTAHLCCCQECSNNFKSGDNCPICRQKIDKTIKTY